MSHLEEKVLGLYAIDPARVSPAERAHLDACPECQTALQELRNFEEILRDPVTWIGVAGELPEAGDGVLRAYAARMAEEDAEALELLEGFDEPAAAARFAWIDVANKPRYQTGGVARLLCKWANGMCDGDPLYALKLAETATVISQSLPDDSYPRNTIHELRGDSLKAQANAYFSLGRFPEATRALDWAESEYRQLPHENAGLSAVQYVRGSIYYEQGDFDEAERAIAEASDAARRVGDDDRYINAREVLGQILYDRHRVAAAATVFESVLRYGQEQGSIARVARGSLALGICYTDLGRTLEAERHLAEALRLFTNLVFKPYVTRVHWAMARLIFAQGNPSEAIYRLRRCIEEFSRYALATDAALVAVDLAEIMHAADRTRDIPKVLANVVRVFMDVGKLTSALTALAYLKDAASSGNVTPGLVAYVRRFVQRAERQPELLFAPPPQDPV